MMPAMAVPAKGENVGTVHAFVADPGPLIVRMVDL
jgi:hypothetical protein